MADEQDSASEEKSEAAKSLPSILPLGTRTPWGRIGAVTNRGGERFYMMSKSKGAEVALMPADIVEYAVTDMKPSDPDSNIKVNAKSPGGGQKGRI